MSRMLHRLSHDDAGQDLVEYALLVSLLAIFSYFSLFMLHYGIQRVYAKVLHALRP